MKVTEVMLKSSGLCLEVKGSREEIVRELMVHKGSAFIELACRMPGTEKCEMYSLAVDEIGLVGSTYDTQADQEAMADALMQTIASGGSDNSTVN